MRHDGSGCRRGAGQALLGGRAIMILQLSESWEASASWCSTVPVGPLRATAASAHSGRLHVRASRCCREPCRVRLSNRTCQVPSTARCQRAPRLVSGGAPDEPLQRRERVPLHTQNR